MVRCGRQITLDTSAIVQTAEKFERDGTFENKEKAVSGGMFMKTVYGGAFDPETIVLLRSVLDEAWESPRQNHQAHKSKNFADANVKIRNLPNGASHTMYSPLGKPTDMVLEVRLR